MGKGKNYIATNGEIKALTGVTIKDDASTCCTNARALSYGAYPAEYSKAKGNYCTKYNDNYICTNIDLKHCVVSITPISTDNGLSLLINVYDDLYYKNKLS